MRSAFVSIGDLIGDLIVFPRAGVGIFRVWLRNFLYFRYTLGTSLFWIAAEPLLYLLAIGYGVGHLLEDVQGMPYIDFFLPGLLVTSGLLVSFYEASYGTYAKQKDSIYRGMLMSPLSAEELVFGEILWATTKGFVVVLCLVAFALVLGQVSYLKVLPSLGFVLLNCWIFAGFGMMVASFANNYTTFVYIQSGVVIPLVLFSDTYFPVDLMPEPLIWALKASPVLYATQAVREVLYQAPSWAPWLTSLGLLAVATFITNIAVARMARRLHASR